MRAMLALLLGVALLGTIDCVPASSAATPGAFGRHTPPWAGVALSAPAIKAVVAQNARQIQACYARALRGNRRLSGRVSMAWLVDAEGRVRAVRVLASTIEDRTMIQCLQSLVETWLFPAPAGRIPVEVSYPFVFRPT